MLSIDNERIGLISVDRIDKNQVNDQVQVLYMADIMIVDDEPTIQQLMAIILEDMGHKVVAQSPNGDAAINTYLSLEPRPDLVEGRAS